jgi:hypothetical protein
MSISGSRPPFSFLWIDLLFFYLAVQCFNPLTSFPSTKRMNNTHFLIFLPLMVVPYTCLSFLLFSFLGFCLPFILIIHFKNRRKSSLQKLLMTFNTWISLWSYTDTRFFPEYHIGAFKNYYEKSWIDWNIKVNHQFQNPGDPGRCCCYRR